MYECALPTEPPTTPDLMPTLPETLSVVEPVSSASSVPSSFFVVFAPCCSVLSTEASSVTTLTSAASLPDLVLLPPRSLDSPALRSAELDLPRNICCANGQPFTSPAEMMANSLCVAAAVPPVAAASSDAT